MKVIKEIIKSTNKDTKEKKKHLVYFFGLGESIKQNNEKNNWGGWINDKNIDIHLFDYHYMESSYPEHFHDTKFKLKQDFITAIITSIICFAGYSIITSKMSTSVKVPVFIVFLIPAIIITIAITSFYPEIESGIKFITKGKDPIKAGTKLVMDLLAKDVHPNDIILMGNSLGGGIAAEVLKKFKEENIYFTLIHSNSYDSWRNVPWSQKSPIGTIFKLASPIVYIWFKLCSLNYEPNKIIAETKAPVLVTNRIGDVVIDESAQSVYNLLKSKDIKDEKGLKVTALLHCTDQNNAHVEPLTYMNIDSIENLGSEKIEGIDTGQPYEKLLSTFVDTAPEYLEKRGLNKNFDLNDFEKKDFYKEVKKNKVSFIDITSVEGIGGEDTHKL